MWCLCVASRQWGKFLQVVWKTAKIATIRARETEEYFANLDLYGLTTLKIFSPSTTTNSSL